MGGRGEEGVKEDNFAGVSGVDCRLERKKILGIYIFNFCFLNSTAKQKVVLFVIVHGIDPFSKHWRAVHEPPRVFH